MIEKLLAIVVGGLIGKMLFEITMIVIWILKDRRKRREEHRRLL